MSAMSAFNRPYERCFPNAGMRPSSVAPAAWADAVTRRTIAELNTWLDGEDGRRLVRGVEAHLEDVAGRRRRTGDPGE